MNGMAGRYLSTIIISGMMRDRKKNKTTASTAYGGFMYCAQIYSAGTIAPLGQVSQQVPQSKQAEASMT